MATTVVGAGILAGFGLLAGAWRVDDPNTRIAGGSVETPTSSTGSEAPSDRSTGGPTTTHPATSVPRETVAPTTDGLTYLPGDGLPVVRLARITGLGDVSHIVAADDVVLVLADDGTRLIEIDPNTGDEVRRQVVNAGVQVADMVYADGAVWTASMDELALVRLDPYSSERTSIELDVTPSGLVVSEETRQAYVISEQSNVMLRIDLNTSLVTGSLDLERPAAIIEGPGGEVWISSRTSESVVRVDPDPTGPITVLETVMVSFGPASMTTYQSNVWVANVEAGSVSRIGVSTDVSSTVQEEPYPGVTLDRLVAVEDLVWIFDFRERMILLSGNGFNELDNEPVDVAVAGSTVWVTSADEVVALQTG